MEKTFHPIAMDRKELSDMHLQIRRMCHDLNAPLRAIHGFADILQRREAEQLSEKGNMYLQRMVAATHTMEQIVSRLHQYARLATHEIKLKPVSIAQFTEEVIATHYRNLPAGASLQWQADQSPVWRSDPVLLETMLRELVDNALCYTREGSPAQVNIVWRVEQDRLLLAVSDEGMGIAPEYHQRVFDLFERLHGRDQFPGAGTGLTMVLKAVSLLGGAIALASAVDFGATVQISLPNGHGICVTPDNAMALAGILPLDNNSQTPIDRFPLSSSPPAGESDRVSLREFHDKSEETNA